ncbi:16S rRNA (guanine(966)-N(2))-methyltransferase RsmD [Abyssibacter sp.]|uniref:16S rRNA (guanine(966)-N(2))-methyltransferase RsmD n=1 Tax=Abyssibacter sp. TaxID=2320200 RepID=UPI003513654F
MAARRRPSHKPARLHQVRIIGGDWRRRQIPVPDGQGLRPTGDRIRETLLNWLAPRLPGARCLDLYAGTGVLGLEALSRGAAHCRFVESDPAVAEALRTQLGRLDATDRADIITGLAPQVLTRCGGDYDIVFLDPPFGSSLLQPSLAAIAPRLRPGHRVYTECGKTDVADFPAGWVVLKDGLAGQVRYHLLEYQPTTDSSKETP